MICNINIRVHSTSDIPFTLQDINETDVIVTMMILPKNDNNEQPDLKPIGLYNKYCTFEEYTDRNAKNKLKFSKIIEYNHQSKGKRRCTSDYTYEAEQYINFPFIAQLKRVLDIISEREVSKSKTNSKKSRGGKRLRSLRIKYHGFL